MTQHDHLGPVDVLQTCTFPLRQGPPGVAGQAERIARDPGPAQIVRMQRPTRDDQIQIPLDQAARQMFGDTVLHPNPRSGSARPYLPQHQRPKARNGR